MHTQSPSLDGILLVDKPTNCTSHDMVDFVRKKFRFKKVGHCGTLDPLATGLIILTLERGTKIQDLLMSEDKVYEGTLELGKVTDTQDAQGKIIEEHPVAPEIQNQIPQAFKKFSGDFYQLPPMVSAIKKDGVPLYKLARQGKTIEREPRLVHVYRHEIQRIALPEVDFLVECSKGFYVRTYCHDIGQLLGCGGHLKKLRRTRSGNFNVQQALTHDQLKAMESIETLRPHIISLPEVSRIRRF
ncbi:MAG: tRNA pseudouridine(55) synthase TruB [Verrucomicrobiia bacterium]